MNDEFTNSGASESSPTENQILSSEDSLNSDTSEDTSSTDVTGHDYTELISTIGQQIDVLHEDIQVQTSLQAYATGFLMFFTLVVLCTYVYKFFRLFF